MAPVTTTQAHALSQAAAFRAKTASVRVQPHRGAVRCSSGRTASTSSLRVLASSQQEATGQRTLKCGRSEFRLLLAATTQATVDLQAFEAWSGRLNMILLFGALISEAVSGAGGVDGIFTGIAQVDVQTFAELSGAMVVAGAVAAVASRPASIGSRTMEELTAAWPLRSLFSRSLTTSVLLVEDEQSRSPSTVTRDIYRSVLRETLDDVIAKHFTVAARVEEAEAPPAAEAQRVPIPLHVRSVIEDLRDV